MSVQVVPLCALCVWVVLVVHSYGVQGDSLAQANSHLPTGVSIVGLYLCTDA